MEKVTYGVVGCGYFGGELARIISRMERARVAAVYGGTRAKSLAEELGCDEAAELGDLVRREDIDAIVVASPSHMHKDAVMRAAEAGKHIFCEKPVALSLQDCDEMIAACRKSGVVFMAGHIMHFMNGVKQAKQWIADGEIGRPIVCHAERTGWEERQEAVSWKKNQNASGGHLFHHIHELDFLQSIMGPAEAVTMAAGNLAHQGEGYGDEDDVLLLTLEFPGGALGTMQYGSGFRWGEHFVKINGTEGAILLDMTRSKVQLKKGDQVVESMLNYSEEEDRERSRSYRKTDGGVAYGTAASQIPGWLQTVMKLEMEAFRDAVLGKEPESGLSMLFDGSAGRSSIATAEASLRSARTKRRVII
ncbi:Gfo/Idh/MocA family oxidoreductase [Paenibacillus doosanensis]|uniref:Gfo/Idh/MocA family protein n=1 Tax=Paenibacillus doosanensis TaxID=1229154 RepID=UPI00218020FC|nr:Gfo/Idh/MocA family oxidoreductase [Paenibacillus doosanensis]MCS7464795.1 Gfo/Idh/MocA family oxidoreductase [Paenibacillus doosanensis]